LGRKLMLKFAAAARHVSMSIVEWSEYLISHDWLEEVYTYDICMYVSVDWWVPIELAANFSFRPSPKAYLKERAALVMSGKPHMLVHMVCATLV
jgi:hypothetical protein